MARHLSAEHFSHFFLFGDKLHLQTAVQIEKWPLLAQFRSKMPKMAQLKKGSLGLKENNAFLVFFRNALMFQWYKVGYHIKKV